MYYTKHHLTVAPLSVVYRLFCCIITTPEFLPVVLMLHVFLFPSFFTAGAITGVVIASIVGVGIVVAVIIAIFCHRPLGKWLKKIITNMRRHRTEGMLEFIGSDVIIDDVIFISSWGY